MVSIYDGGRFPRQGSPGRELSSGPSPFWRSGWSDQSRLLRHVSCRSPALESRNVKGTSKRRGALITTFSRHFVKDGPLAAEVGRAINETQELRHEADYEGLPLSRDDVARAVQAAEAFVAAIERLLRDP